MLDKAIKLMKKQRDMYIIQNQNMPAYTKNKMTENKLRANIRNEIQIRDYIIEVLENKKLQN